MDSNVCTWRQPEAVTESQGSFRFYIKEALLYVATPDV